MAEPENFILTLLRDIRREMNERFDAVNDRFDRRFEKIDLKLAEHDKRFESLRQALQGESLLGQFATAEFGDRIQAIEKRLEALETRS